MPDTDAPRTMQSTELFIVKLMMAGTLTTGVKSKGESVFVAPYNFTVLGGYALVGTAPTDASLILNVSKVSQAAGTSANLYTTNANRPTIAATATQSWTGSTAFAKSSVPDTDDVLAGDILKLNVIQIGSTVAGADVALFLSCEKA